MVNTKVCVFRETVPTQPGGGEAGISVIIRSLEFIDKKNSGLLIKFNLTGTLQSALSVNQITVLILHWMQTSGSHRRGNHWQYS